jgi:DNA polymerase-4
VTVSPRILLVDADAFYVAVARLVDPEGAGKAPLLIVGGSAAGRGVVTSASYEARAFGVQSAMPTARALRLCPGATVVPVPWEACVEKSNEIHDVLKQFTPAVERASSDEFYLDLGGTERLYHGEPLAQTARRIRTAVMEATGLPVSIGAGPTKVVAKLAAGIAKPRPGTSADGVEVVPSDGVLEFMRRFTLAEVPQIGPKLQERLATFGLVRVSDALVPDRRTLCAWLGERTSAWLYDRVRGLDESRVATREIPKSLSRDETFPKDITDDAELGRELLRMVDRAAADLRDARLVARTVTVKLRDWDFTTRQASRTLPDPIQSDRAVQRVARSLLHRLRAARHVPARLIGVALGQLLPAHGADQLGLFPTADPEVESERDVALARAVDELRERFGFEAVRRASPRQ